MNERADQGRRLLSQEQVTQAIAILHEERRAHPITPKQMKSFRLFRVSFWVFWVLYGCWLVGVLMVDLGPNPSPEFKITESLNFILFLALVLCCLPLLISIRGTWSLFRQTWQQFRLARRTGLWRILKVKPRRPWWARLMLWIMMIIAFCSLPIFVMTAMAVPVAGWLMPLAIPLYIFVHYAGPRIELLDDARELQNLLEHKADAPEASAPGGLTKDFVQIPSGDFEKLALIEDAQIQRRRAEAIETVAEEKPAYSLLKSRTVLSDTSKLDWETRLRVESRSSKLAADPNPPEAIQAPGGKTWHLPVPGTTVEILYVVDKDAQRIELMSLGSIEQEVPSLGKGGTPHA